MKLITEKPETVYENMHNFVYVKDREVYVRHFNGDMNLVDYICKIDKELYGIEHDKSYCNAEDFAEYMDEERFTCELYLALVGFAEVREKLKRLESNE